MNSSSKSTFDKFNQNLSNVKKEYIPLPQEIRDFIEKIEKQFEEASNE